MTKSSPQKLDRFSFLASFCAFAKEFISHKKPSVIGLVLVSLLTSVLEIVSIVLLVPVLLSEPNSALLPDWLADPLGLGSENLTDKISIGLTAVVALVALRGLLLWYRDAKIANVTMGFVNQKRQSLLLHIEKADWLSVVKSSKIGLHHSFLDDSLRLEMVAHAVIHSIVMSFFLLAQIVFAFYLAPGLTVLVLGLLLVGVFLLQPFLRKANQLGHDTIDINKSLFGETDGFLAALKQVRVSGQQNQFVEELSDGLDQQRILALKSASQYGAMSFAFSLGMTLAIAAIIAAGLFVFSIPMPSLVILILLFARITPPLQGLMGEAQSFAENYPAYLNLQNQMSLLKLPKAHKLQEIVAAENQVLVLENISFGYSDETKVIENFSLTIERGEKIAITGASGAGKTTLLDVISGLIRPTDGRISIDAGKGGSSTYYLVQSPYIPESNVRDFLRQPTHTASDQDLWNALETVNLSHRIKELDDQLDNVLVQNGSVLSGGEKQRLLLAKVFLNPPKLLLLDEATNAIDFDLEVKLFERLTKHHPDMTILSVGHRANWAQWADRVVEISKFEAKV